MAARPPMGPPLLPVDEQPPEPETSPPSSQGPLAGTNRSRSYGSLFCTPSKTVWLKVYVVLSSRQMSGSVTFSDSLPDVVSSGSCGM